MRNEPHNLDIKIVKEKLGMNDDKHVNHLASLCGRYDDSHVHCEMDDGTTIGAFFVEDTVSEMEEIGKPETPGKYMYVYIRSHEGSVPHFHVFDEEGRNRTKKDENSGFHACVEIRRNAYFKYEPYFDNLSKKMRIALNVFMNQIRSEDKYGSGVGQSNYIHTIDQWNDNNAQDRKPPKWVDPNPKVTPKPDYTTIIDNLK